MSIYESPRLDYEEGAGSDYSAPPADDEFEDFEVLGGARSSEVSPPPATSPPIDGSITSERPSDIGVGVGSDVAVARPGRELDFEGIGGASELDSATAGSLAPPSPRTKMTSRSTTSEPAIPLKSSKLQRGPLSTSAFYTQSPAQTKAASQMTSHLSGVRGLNSSNMTVESFRSSGSSGFRSADDESYDSNTQEYEDLREGTTNVALGQLTGGDPSSPSSSIHLLSGQVSRKTPQRLSPIARDTSDDAAGVPPPPKSNRTQTRPSKRNRGNDGRFVKASRVSIGAKIGGSPNRVPTPEESEFIQHQKERYKQLGLVSQEGVYPSPIHTTTSNSKGNSSLKKTFNMAKALISRVRSPRQPTPPPANLRSIMRTRTRNERQDTINSMKSMGMTNKQIEDAMRQKPRP